MVALVNPASGSSDVLVIGGGLQGLSSAFQLAKAGLRVRLIEAEYCGRHASGVNAGGVRTLGRHVAEIPLALAAREQLWHRLADIIGSDGGFVPSGQLQVAENEADEIKAKARVAMLNGLGFFHEQWVDQQQVRELVPSISPHVVGGIWADRDGYALPYKVATAYRLAAEKLGVQIVEQAPVLRVDHQAGMWQASTAQGAFHAPWLVNTAGAWAADFAAQVGDPVPMVAGGLMLMVTQRVAPFVKPVLGAMGRPLSFKQFDNGTVLIGGGLRCEADASQRHAMVDLNRMPKSAQTVIDLFPHLRDVSIARAWTGIEGFMPDEIPVISPSASADNLVHAFGFSAHGFELSPMTGCIVAELVTKGTSSLPISAFRVDRFAAA
ncbi:MULTISPECIES: NAD(P)/FAD-dependent oxidoreductase [Comamonas]|jgi:sarcosine oxidase subunit beta|uniref:FAD-binding oxidoreductase n=1 Tax=Comamonas squillarum TaxID=2977320 RepID=A0ABY5ZU44_9BURK|nr:MULTISPECIES: FAD-dependent oxidoreductase [Comamonas]UXC17498.1 FAD-binding oxidoreductase [Comamonas sp. PR12]